MLIVGLTGGIATGKSTASQTLRGDGVPVVDLDVIARLVVEPGRPAHARIVRAFGPGVLLADGHIDRPTLGKVVFEDAAKRKELNKAVHGAIFWELLAQLAALFASGCGACVVDAPLLFEAKLHHLCAAVIVIAAKDDVQLKRLMLRDNLDEEAARARVAAQMTTREKCARASHVVDNNGSREAAAASLRAHWSAIAGSVGAQPTARLPWLRLPRARHMAAAVMLWLVFAGLHLTTTGRRQQPRSARMD